MKSNQPSPTAYLTTGLIFLVLFSVVCWGVYFESGWVHALDQYLIETIQANITENRTDILIKLTEIGNVRVIIVLTIILVLILFLKRWYAAGLWFGGTILLCAAIINKLLKSTFDRTRPDILQLIEKTNESFPSGHATATTIFYGLLGLAAILLTTKVWKKVVIGLVTLALTIFILFSRIYLGVHFPTDVIAGFFYGSAAVVISIAVYVIVAEPLQRGLRKMHLNDQSEIFSQTELFIRRRDNYF